jgi:hypothetical protein
MCASPRWTLELRGATDELLDQLAEVVRAGKTQAHPAPYDDPMSFYEPDPARRVAKWLRSIWRRRGNVEPDAWRLYFVVMVDGRPVGEQALTGVDFSAIGTVTTFSWLSIDQRGRGLGHEMWAANRSEHRSGHIVRLSDVDLPTHGQPRCRSTPTD